MAKAFSPFDRFRSFSHDDIIAKHIVIAGTQGLLMLQIIDKDDQAAKHLNKIEQCFVAWSSLSKLH